MKILSVTAQKPDSTGSGVYLTELVKGFHKMGHTQAVVCGITREDWIHLPEGVEKYPVFYESEELPFSIAGMSDEMPYRSTRYLDLSDEMTKQFAAAFKRKVFRAVEELKPDVILCHHLYFLTALIRMWFPEQKVYGISHGSDIRQITKNTFERDFIKKQISRLDGVFALHEEQRTEIQRIYGCCPEMIRVIGTGYNSDIFYLDRSKHKQDEKVRLVFAGKISEKKGVKSLLNSMQYLPEKYILSLAGSSGNEKEYREICEIAENYPGRVEFLGRLSQDKLAEKMNEGDLFVLPSFFEGLPLVLIEAMACGLRCVCTDLPGIKEWLHEKMPNNRVIFVEPPEMIYSDEPVKEKLPAFEKRLAESIIDATTVEEPNQESVKELSWEKLCEWLLSIWENK